MYRHILVPLDGSSAAEQALSHAEQLALATGARLSLLAVVPRPGWAHVPQVPQLDEQSRRLAEDYLTARVQDVRSHGLAADCIIEFGHVGHAISVLSDDAADVDLIVMATRGADAAGAPRVGSVALQVLMEARCPVLMVYVPPEEQSA